MNISRVRQAFQEYQDRQARLSHPDGAFDQAGRWYPAPEEVCDCCEHVRLPSRNWPYSLLVHCRSAKHVARLFGVQRKDMLALKRRKEGKE